MKDHKGTISQVPKVTIDLKRSNIPVFKREGQIGSIRLAFQPETHLCRRFWFSPSCSATGIYAVLDASVDSSASSSGKDLVVGSDTPRKIPESGITLRCKKTGSASLVIKLAHKSSLWPTEKTFVLTD